MEDICLFRIFYILIWHFANYLHYQNYLLIIN